LFAKTDVNGPNTCEVYRYLRTTSTELYDPVKKEAREIQWSFSKFLVNKQGKVVSYHNPRVEVNELEKRIEELLNQ